MWVLNKQKEHVDKAPENDIVNMRTSTGRGTLRGDPPGGPPGGEGGQTFELS